MDLTNTFKFQALPSDDEEDDELLSEDEEDDELPSDDDEYSSSDDEFRDPFEQIFSDDEEEEEDIISRVRRGFKAQPPGVPPTRAPPNPILPSPRAPVQSTKQPRVPPPATKPPRAPVQSTKQPRVPPPATKTQRAPLPKQPSVPQLQPMARATVITDPTDLMNKLPGITISTLTPATYSLHPDINDILAPEADESDADFEARRRLTLRIKDITIEDLPVNNVAAVVLAFAMMRKAKLGLEYDSNIEATIRTISAAL